MKENSIAEKAVKIVGYGTLAAAFGLITFISYLMLWPPVIVEVKSAHAVTPVIKAGDTMFYEINYCRYLSGSGIVSRTWHKIDESHTYPTPLISPVTVKGCAKTKLPVITYETMEKGEYYLLVEAVFSPNALREDHLVFKVEGITIE